MNEDANTPQNGEQWDTQPPAATPGQAANPPQAPVPPQQIPLPPHAPAPPQAASQTHQWPGWVPQQYWMPAPPPAPRRSRWGRRVLAGLGAAAVVAGALAGGYALHSPGSTSSPQASSGALAPNGGSSGGPNGPGGPGADPFSGPYGNGWDYGSGGYPNYPFGGGSGSGRGNGSKGNQTSASQASASQQVGVVDINSVLGYENAESAGTGLVLSSSGEILTNNHVIDGATQITVTVVSTGAKYTATVVGTDPSDDLAVLSLKDASGLHPAAIGNSSSAKVGDSVTAVGNAGGVGGTPSAVSGEITKLDQSITATDENGSDAESLTGLIETNAQIEAGDSGGPLYNSSGKIIGIDTAAQSTSYGATTAGYAIPIDTAESIAAKIVAGQTSPTIHLGLPAFLGVSIDTHSSGAVISDVVPDGPAAKAGILAGDTITAVGSTKTSTPSSVSAALRAYKPGDKATVSWTDADGASHSATVTLATGPAD